jgi:hypothetical protein
MTDLAATETPAAKHDSVPLTALLEVLARVKVGDFTARMPLEWTGLAGKVADSLNDDLVCQDPLPGGARRHRK